MKWYINILLAFVILLYGFFIAGYLLCKYYGVLC